MVGGYVLDAAVTKAVISLYGGKRGLIVNSRDLCKGRKQRVQVDLTGQNGRRYDVRPVIGTRCGGKKR